MDLNITVEKPGDAVVVSENTLKALVEEVYGDEGYWWVYGGTESEGIFPVREAGTDT
ncbi:MAG: hypothetical protein GXO63_01900 [Candidatus Micrarchaeota archaeon]|nr:hypothetical protein [Candidatus Micrarchaeota archaeon]